jgi:hypothetical protein
LKILGATDRGRRILGVARAANKMQSALNPTAVHTVAAVADCLECATGLHNESTADSSPLTVQEVHTHFFAIMEQHDAQFDDPASVINQAVEDVSHLCLSLAAPRE